MPSVWAQRAYDFAVGVWVLGGKLGRRPGLHGLHDDACKADLGSLPLQLKVLEAVQEGAKAERKGADVLLPALG